MLLHLYSNSRELFPSSPSKEHYSCNYIIHNIKIARVNDDVSNGFHIIGKDFMLTDPDLHEKIRLVPTLAHHCPLKLAHAELLVMDNHRLIPSTAWIYWPSHLMMRQLSVAARTA